MKGIVFREFIDMVETQFSIETADRIIAAAQPASGGAYTSVGTYPHEEMVALVSALSTESGRPVPALLRHFGRHLFQRFTTIHPEHVTSHASAFELLRRLDGQIHVEVHKLYSGAELPSFEHEAIDARTMVFVYRSRRPLADFAHGLIEGCVTHFNESVTIERVELPADEGAHTRFTLQRMDRSVL